MGTDEIINSYSVKDNPEKIEEIRKKIRGIGPNNFRMTRHCKKRVGGDEKLRGFDEKIIFNNMPKLEKIKVVNIRKLKYGDLGHDVYYELSNTKTLLVTLCFRTKQIINAILKRRNWKNFIRKRFT